MAIHTNMEALLEKIAEECRGIDRKSVERFESLIISAKRIFVTGAGRSGLVGKAFAMRLMHLGFTVYIVGETTTPAVSAGDLLVAISGSGETSSIVMGAKTAKVKGASVVAVTSMPESSVGKLADSIVMIRGRNNEERESDYNARQMSGEHEPTTPLGTLFELSAIVFLDSAVAELMVKQNKSEENMRRLHTNLE